MKHTTMKCTQLKMLGLAQILSLEPSFDLKIGYFLSYFKFKFEFKFKFGN